MINELDPASETAQELESPAMDAGAGNAPDAVPVGEMPVQQMPINPGKAAMTAVRLPHPFDVVSLPADLTLLQKLVDDVKSRAEGCRRWYDSNASVQAVASRRLRRISVGLVVLGGLCPLIPDSLWGAQVQPYGYLLLAAAAGVVVFDRAFGYSSSWMRYRIAHMRIDRALSLYGNTAAMLLAGADLQSDTGRNNVRALVAATQTFLESIEDLVVEETEAWLQEFKAEQISFQQQFGKRDQPSKAG
ncbi:MAG: SLATT domain-containing protein [Pseudomarimonas sp.]